jgi:hypothetical protein
MISGIAQPQPALIQQTILHTLFAALLRTSAGQTLLQWILTILKMIQGSAKIISLQEETS